MSHENSCSSVYRLDVNGHPLMHWETASDALRYVSKALPNAVPEDEVNQPNGVTTYTLREVPVHTISGEADPEAEPIPGAEGGMTIGRTVVRAAIVGPKPQDFGLFTNKTDGVSEIGAMRPDLLPTLACVRDGRPFLHPDETVAVVEPVHIFTWRNSESNV